jgi:hypothetical protein
MDDGPDIGLVDTHSKGDCGHDDAQITAHKRILNGPSTRGLLTSMVRFSAVVDASSFLISRLTLGLYILQISPNHRSYTFAFITASAIDNDRIEIGKSIRSQESQEGAIAI